MTSTQIPAGAFDDAANLTDAVAPRDDALPRRRPARAHYFMVLPPVILYTIFVTWPAIQGVFYSFTNYAGFGSWHFVGLANYRAMFSDPELGHAYWFTFAFAILSTLLSQIFALAIAIGLNSRIKFKNGFQTIFFLPMVLAGLVVSYSFKYIFNTTLPYIIGWGPIGDGLLVNASTAWIPIVIVATWIGAPGAIIIYLAGLASVGTDVYEASEIDGAKPWKTFRYITFPLLAGFVVINTVLGLKGALNVYDLVIGLTNGGPGNATTVVSMTIVGGLNTGEFAYSAAKAVVFAIVTILISILQLAIIRRRGQGGL